MYVQNKLPLPPFLLLENTVVSDFCVNIHFVYSFTFFFFFKEEMYRMPVFKKRLQN